MAEAAGIEPANNRVKICCLSPLATLLGGTGYWNRTNTSWFRARCASVTPILYVVGRAGFEPAAFPMSLIYSQFPSPVWIPTHVVGGAGSDPALQYASRIARFLRLTRSRRLWLAPAQPSGYAALLSVVSQLLSVCIPTGFYGRELPYWWGIQDLNLGHYSSIQLS